MGGMPRTSSTQRARAFNDAWTRIATALFVDARPMDGLEVTDNQLLVLYVLADRGACRVGVLAERAGVVVPALSRTLRGLEQRGLVARTADPDDRRASLVSLAADGERMVELHRGRVVDAIAGMLDQLPASDQDEVVALAHRIDALLGTNGEEPAIG